MARLEQLLESIPNGELRAALESEVAALKSRVRFGLVHERHIPETVLVGDIDGLRIGDHVRPRAEAANNGHDYRVVSLNGSQARIVALKSGRESDVSLSDLLAVRGFGGSRRCRTPAARVREPK